MTFRYKVKRPPAKDLPVGAIQRANDGEMLSGYVMGYKASDIEERFARALKNSKRVDGMQFRFPIISPKNMVGQLEIDFVVQSGGLVYSFQVDGEYAHKGIGKKQDDARKDVLANHYMRKYNSFPVKRIPGDKLRSQPEADFVVRELIR